MSRVYRQAILFGSLMLGFIDLIRKIFPRLSNEFYFPCSKIHHSQEQPTMAPAINVCGSIRSFAVANWYFDDLEIEAGGAKKEIVITERVEVAEVAAVGVDFFVMSA